MKPVSPLDPPTPFRTLARLVDFGVLIVTPDRTLDFMSDRARELLHAAPDDDLAACWSRVRARIEPALDRADAARDAASGPITTRDEGGARALHLDVYRLPSASETQPGYLVLLKDDDAFRGVEQALHLALQQHQASRYYEALAHDLRQPIGAILIHLKVLEEIGGRTPPDGASAQAHFADSLDTVRSEVQELDRSLRLLLHELAPATAEAPLSLRAIVQHVARLIEPQAHKEDLALCTELPDEALMVHGCRTRIQQAVLSLATHALDTTPKGTVTLRLSTRGDRACLEVTDEGPGLSEDERARLFERPSSAEEPTRSGLHLARQTARAYGGDADVQSTPGEGTIRTLLLPLLAPAEA